MQQKACSSKGKSLVLELGRPNSEAQRRFFEAEEKYIAFGGARGGGKTWALRTKALGGAIANSGIKILILRRVLADLQATIIDPMRRIMPAKIYSFDRSRQLIKFKNASTIKFGHLLGDKALERYQGQEFDWIFIDEATQFTEKEFRTLAACLRGINNFSKRIYLTCNPGGVGHQWIKRLFINRNFRENEYSKDYIFIQATVEDNKDLLKYSPDYVKQLDLLPENLRKAHRYGDWDALAGQYFSEFQRKIHCCEPFEIPNDWKRYRAFDYGLDMLACVWVANDDEGHSYVYRELSRPGLIISEAAEVMKELTLPGEKIEFTIAPPDMWSRQKETGKTMAQVFAENGLSLVNADNSRVPGWLMLKEKLKIKRDGRPGLMIFNDCKLLIEHLGALLHSQKNPSDCDTQPHEITHLPDALRYFAITRTMVPKPYAARDSLDIDYMRQGWQRYVNQSVGGELDDSYLEFIF